MTHFGMKRAAADRRAAELLHQVGIPNPRRAPGRLPASVLGRHATARNDCDGPRVRAEAADRRRADDGARRDDPGADPGPPRALVAEREHGADHDHPRPRGRRGHVRTCPRDVCRHVRGDGRGRTSSSHNPVTRTPWACCKASHASTSGDGTKLKPIQGQPRNMLSAPTSCPFAPRCRYVHRDAAREELPLLEPIGGGTQQIACFNPVTADEWTQSRLGGAA